jgi:hypothetical protein
MRNLIRVLLVAALALVLIGGTTAAHARPGRHHHHTPKPTPVVTPPPTSTPTPPTAPAGFREDFTTSAAAGKVAAAYVDSWQPYPDGSGDGKYTAGKTVSVHDGYLDVTLDGSNGAAGTFGTREGAWDHKGGTFTVRAKATGGDGNGAAFMLWPTSNVWADGEIDFPEGNFDDAPSVFHHSMTPGEEASAEYIDTGVTWRDWHTYSMTWVPGKSVTYSVDGKVIGTVTHDVPASAHRFMFQTGNWGAAGHLLIDWVETP